MDGELNIPRVVDVGAILKAKRPDIDRWIPRWIVRLMERLIHQQEVNEGLAQFGHLKGIEFARAALKYLGVEVSVQGLENIPPAERCIFYSNHPLGGLDGIALISAVGQVRSDLYFLVNDILMNIHQLDNIFVPVNKIGANSREHLKRIDETYSGDGAVLIFPSGMVSRQVDGTVTDMPWKKSFVSKAMETKRSVVPIYVSGTNSKIFYRVARWRTRLGIAVNLEMLLLPHEMFKRRGKPIQLIVGKPIPYTYFSSKQTVAQTCDSLREKLYELGGHE